MPTIGQMGPPMLEREAELATPDAVTDTARPLSAPELVVAEPLP